MPGFLANLSAKVIAAIIGAVLVIALALIAWGAWQHSRTEAARARLSASQTQAALDSGKDAVATVGAAGVREQGIQAQTEKNDADIRAAKGADAAVDPAVRDAGLRALCMRNAYIRDARCVQFSHP